jgi:hypothetical protein
MSSNEIEEFTVSTHIIVSISITLLVWFLFAKPITRIGPGKTLNLMYFTMFIWCILFPTIILITKTYDDSITEQSTGESIFVLLKFVSVLIALFAIQGFIIYNNSYKKLNFNTMTIVLSLILIVNIGEACYTQFKLWVDDKKPNKIIDLINPIIGLLLNVIVIIKIFNKKPMKISTTKDSIQLSSGFDIWFIIAYTAWNLLFRSRLGESTVIIIFTLTTLVLPLITHLTNTGDWLQVRTIGLLAYLIIILGITEGQGRLFPIYNTQGYDKHTDEQSIITKIQKEEWYSYSLLILGATTLVPSFYTVLK